MKFSRKCRTKKLRMIYTISGSFAHLIIGKGPIFGPKSGQVGKSLTCITVLAEFKVSIF